MNMLPTVVIGAGPYGLSVAAHLKAAGIPTCVFGKPMSFWQEMPPGMLLRSPLSASSLSAPGGAHCIDRYLEMLGLPAPAPIPLRHFIDYGLWFQRQVVPDVDPTYVRSVSGSHGVFSVTLADGRRLDASRVVVASGIDSFANVPVFARGLSESVASHSGTHKDFSRFAGAHVAIVGAGQSAIEWAALLNEAGAQVELIARGTVRWLKLHDYHGAARRVLYAPSDVGPPGLSWLVHFPLVFRRFPDKPRKALSRRAVRPAGARWLMDRVVGHVPLTTGTQVVAATERGGGVHLDLSNGSTRQVDHLVLATGYKPSVDKISFLGTSLLDRIRQQDGFPILNRWLESSVPGLHFAGGLATHSYGPLCKFVAGDDVASRQIAAYASRGSPN